LNQRIKVPELHDRVVIQLEGTVNALWATKDGRSTAANGIPAGAMVFVPKEEWGRDIHGWAHGQNITVRLEDIIENHGPYSSEED
jgi:hypothetical protein